MKYVILYILVFASANLSQENNWKDIDTFKNQSIFCIALNSKGYIFVGSWLGKLSVSSDNGETWSVNNIATIKNLIFCLNINSEDYIFAGTIGGGIYRSTDDGNSWTYSGLNDYSVISIASDSKNVLYAATGGKSSAVFKSSDNGDTWNISGTELENTNIQALAVNSKDQIFAGTLNGIFLSNDGGKTWIQKNNGLTNTSVYSLGINSNDCIFAGTLYDGEIFYSRDSGESWINKSNASIKSFIRSFAFYNEKYILTASYDGIFRSDNTGDSWTALNDGSADKMMLALVINRDGIAYTGTWAHGAYKIFNPLLSADEKAIPEAFVLEQNYPNPFNPSTKIRYSIPASSFVRLKVYDILGNEIAVLVNEEKSPGIYEIVFSSQYPGGRQIPLSSGVYFYSLQAGEFSSTKKFIILK
ncbi:MAG TPA: T9SS type A sorting domain-containing protein [Ignavibacteriaceae bacterium]|nr:T9SS type A sorting domain-containing protein [Ignavibacteriaceae bacterium]